MNTKSAKKNFPINAVTLATQNCGICATGIGGATAKDTRAVARLVIKPPGSVGIGIPCARSNRKRIIAVRNTVNNVHEMSLEGSSP